MADPMTCPHRRYHREATHYRCVYCGEPLPLGEPVTEPIETWKDKEDACRK
jgi:hypothetical protein